MLRLNILYSLSSPGIIGSNIQFPYNFASFCLDPALLKAEAEYFIFQIVLLSAFPLKSCNLSTSQYGHGCFVPQLFIPLIILNNFKSER